jgi:hypothetical protein
MILPQATARPAGDLFTAMDYWRGATGSSTAIGHKEWSHFSIMAGELDLLVNFSVMEDLNERRSPPSRRPRLGRLTVLHRDAAGRWDGEVEPFEPAAVSIRKGLPGIQLGASTARIAAEVYRLELALPSGRTRGWIELVPSARPVFANRVRLAGGEYIRWLVVPRLVARGEIRLGGRTVVLEGAPAYHDRNWGEFTWGGGCAWEWATILPSQPKIPWSLVYSRISDRMRGETLSQSLILWREEFPHRKFFGRDLSVEQRGLLSGSRPLQIPKFMDLLSGGIDADVPRTMRVRATAYQDELCLEIRLADFAQIGIPNDGRWGVSKLSEAAGAAQVDGCVGGEQISFEGRIHAEFNQPAG